MSQARPKLKNWEILLITLSVLLLGSSAFVYLNHIPLRKYLFGIDDGSSEAGEQIGELNASNGIVRRQTRTSAQFDLLDTKTGLYLDDTIMTGPNSSAKILLDDGGTLELAANSMIRLNFDSKFSLSGISRVPIVEVMSGTVQAKAASQDIVVRKKNEPARVVKATTTESPPPRPKLAVQPKPEPTLAKQTPKPIVSQRSLPTLPPMPSTPAVPPVLAVASPSPSPLAEASPEPSASAPEVEVVLLLPKNGAKLSLPSGASNLELKQELKWKITPDQAVEVALIGDTGEVIRQTVPSVQGLGSLAATLKTPGKYTWELLMPEGGQWFGEKKYKSSFTLAPDFLGIEILPPLVGGESIASNQFKGKHLNDFDVTLRWKPYKNVKNYTIRITNQSRKLLIERTVETEAYSFNKKKVYLEQLYYTVSAKLRGGFVVRSKEEGFFFNFQSPQQTYPFNLTSVSASAKAKGQQQPGVLFTWQKTNFTDSYEFEMASDADFKTEAVLKPTLVNFIVLKGLKPGKYYWRVRSIGNSVKSPPSTGFQITITP